jgi:RNA polymerase sigma-70 factor, ECF subfamily
MDDAELVARLKQYDADATNEVVQRYGAALHRYIAAIVGDHHLAEDLVSETYVRMLEHIGGYTYTGAPFRSWLYRIAHNLAINSVKRERVVNDEAALARVTVDEADPARHVERVEEHAELREALTTLTEEQQQVLLLRFVAEQPTAEVARALQRTEGSVKLLQFRGLRSLARRLGRTEVGDGA